MRYRGLSAFDDGLYLGGGGATMMMARTMVISSWATPVRSCPDEVVDAEFSQEEGIDGGGDPRLVGYALSVHVLCLSLRS